MRGTSRVNFLARGALNLLRGSKSWKEGSEFPPPFPMTFPVGMGREGASFTTTFRAAMTRRRRTADSAGLSTRSTARWNPRNRICAIKPQQGEQGRNDAVERFPVKFDGPGPAEVRLPVHRVFLSCIKNKSGTYELNRNRLSRGKFSYIPFAHVCGV